MNPEDLEGLMTFYEQGREKAPTSRPAFDSALQAFWQVRILSSVSKVPATVKPGQTYRFQGSRTCVAALLLPVEYMPDDELLTVATQGRLKDPIMLEKQVARMLAAPRSESLATKFGALWLHLHDLRTSIRTPFYYPQYDHTLANALKRETELFFDSIVREDRNVVDLLTANHTFVDERRQSTTECPTSRQASSAGWNSATTTAAGCSARAASWR